MTYGKRTTSASERGKLRAAESGARGTQPVKLTQRSAGEARTRREAQWLRIAFFTTNKTRRLRAANGKRGTETCVRSEEKHSYGERSGKGKGGGLPEEDQTRKRSRRPAPPDRPARLSRGWCPPTPPGTGPCPPG